MGRFFQIRLLSYCTIAVLCLVGCGRGPASSSNLREGGGGISGVHSVANFSAGAAPQLLSQTGVFDDVAAWKLAKGFVAYDVAVPFWSDGAEKLRWIGLPEGKQIHFSATGEFQFPAGTVLVKHFDFVANEGQKDVRRRLETRILVCNDKGGVDGATYKWRADGKDADLVSEPIIEAISQKGEASGGAKWYYPGRADCQMCHSKVPGGLLGVNARQLNRSIGKDGENELLVWNRLGMFDAPVDQATIRSVAALAKGDDLSRSVGDRARSFLDVNCGYCHRPGGVAGNFDARFETPLPRQNLIGGPVLIDLGIDRARVIAAGDVWRSIALARVETSDQTKMPPLAHLTVDKASAAVLREWIESLAGPKVLAPPVISPAGGEFAKVARVVLQHADADAEIRYTLDGSAPNKSSPVYQKPLDLTEPVTLRARAYREGMTRSVIVQETFIVNP